jgi:glucosamine-6-phosphate deaminase
MVDSLAAHDVPSSQVSSIVISIHDDRRTLGQTAADQVAATLRTTVDRHGTATLVVATGSSQFEVLAALAAANDVPWPSITIYHLDEYVGLAADHRASFRHFLHERFIDRLPTSPVSFHEIDGLAEPHAECRRLAGLVPDGDFDVAMIGIGENGHLAFNDPPADFATTTPYHLVQLDERCRQQQVGEGWFASLSDVPEHAISMSVSRIMASRTIVCCVPDHRKAEAVKAAVEGPISPAVPASILRRHRGCVLHLDQGSASLLRSPHSVAGT